VQHIVIRLILTQAFEFELRSTLYANNAYLKVNNKHLASAFIVELPTKEAKVR
jgi:hypothetical protein